VCGNLCSGHQNNTPFSSVCSPTKGKEEVESYKTPFSQTRSAIKASFQPSSFFPLPPLPALDDRQSIRLTRCAMVMDGCQLIGLLILCLLMATPAVSINWM
jgi:hypothetical protein